MRVCSLRQPISWRLRPKTGFVSAAIAMPHSIEGYPERIADIAADPERKLTDVPGIGKGIAGIICDILERGTFDKRDQLLAKYPPTALELLKIQGLGPKSIALLIEHFRVSTSMIWSESARSRSCARCLEWERSWRRRFCDRFSSIDSSSGRFLLPFAQVYRR